MGDEEDHNIYGFVRTGGVDDDAILGNVDIKCMAKSSVG